MSHIENCLYSVDSANFNAQFIRVIELWRTDSALQAIWPRVYCVRSFRIELSPKKAQHFHYARHRKLHFTGRCNFQRWVSSCHLTLTLRRGVASDFPWLKGVRSFLTELSRK